MPGGGGSRIQKGRDARRLVRGFWSHLGCSEQTPIFLAGKIYFRLAREERQNAVTPDYVVEVD